MFGREAGTAVFHLPVGSQGPPVLFAFVSVPWREISSPRSLVPWWFWPLGRLVVPPLVSLPCVLLSCWDVGCLRELRVLGSPSPPAITFAALAFLVFVIDFES